MTGIYPAGQTLLTPLTGLEQVQVDGGGATNAFTTTAAIAGLAATENTGTKITALNTVSNGTITAAGIVGKITSRGGAQSATAFSDTTDTAAAIILAMPSGAANGSAFQWRYENTTDGVATLLAGVGVTISGSIIIPKGTWGEFLVTKTSAIAVTMASTVAGSLNPLPTSRFVGFTSTQLGTLTTTQVGSLISGAQIVTVSVTGTVGPFPIQLPDAPTLFAAVPNAIVGQTYQLNIQNLKSTTGVGTVITNTGVTLTGTATIAQNATRSFNVSLDSATTAIITSIGALGL